VHVKVKCALFLSSDDLVSFPLPPIFFINIDLTVFRLSIIFQTFFQSHHHADKSQTTTFPSISPFSNMQGSFPSINIENVHVFVIFYLLYPCPFSTFPSFVYSNANKRISFVKVFCYNIAMCCVTTWIV
jgi:hypothetical protein